MSKEKSLLIKMVFISVLLLIASTFSPTYTFANGDGFITECMGKDKSDNEKCLNNEDGGAGEDETESASSSIGIFDYIKVLFALGLVIGLLIFILKMINRKNLAYQQNSLMKNLGGISVGTQKSVQLLQIGNRLYIVGVGEDISLIREIEDPEEMEQILGYYENKQQEITTVPFLSEMLSKLKPAKNVQSEQPASFNDLFNAKLKNIKKERTEELEGWKEKEKDKYE